MTEWSRHGLVSPPPIAVKWDNHMWIIMNLPREWQQNLVTFRHDVRIIHSQVKVILLKQKSNSRKILLIAACLSCNNDGPCDSYIHINKQRFLNNFRYRFTPVYFQRNMKWLKGEKQRKNSAAQQKVKLYFRIGFSNKEMNSLLTHKRGAVVSIVPKTSVQKEELYKHGGGGRTHASWNEWDSVTAETGCSGSSYRSAAPLTGFEGPDELTLYFKFQVHNEKKILPPLMFLLIRGPNW